MNHGSLNVKGFLLIISGNCGKKHKGLEWMALKTRMLVTKYKNRARGQGK